VFSPTVITLAVAMFSATFGVGIVAPVLPVRAEELGASGTEIGLTFSAFALTQIFVSPFTGRLADRYGRKQFILLGIATYIVAAIGWRQTDSIEVMIALRALTGVGSGLVFALALAYIGDLAPAGEEGRYVGIFGVFEFAGFGLGPIFSGVIRDLAGFDAVFLAMAGMLSLSGITILLFLPSSADRGRTGSLDPPGLGAEPSARLRRVVSWGELLGDRYLQALFAQRVGFSFAFGSAFSFLAIYLEDEIGATATMVGFVLAGQELLGGVLQPVFGPVADRYDRRLLVIIGGLMVASGYAMMALTTDYLVILAAFVGGAGVGSALMNVSSMAIQVDVGRRLGMATTMSFASAGFAVGVLIGSLAAGLIADGVGTPYVFLSAAVAVLFGSTVFVVRTFHPMPEPVPGA
jgi:DHA1 family multidrug resistance protein-like MFS transporter